ncbi:MAG: M48 family metalloprotease [Alphaproteobacteria bacterium]|nr:M48 family metalloprotease [Alphaproteobacteria bacterium]
MDFFESQDQARKSTFQLVFLFILAVIALIVMTNILVIVVFGLIDGEPSQNVGSSLQQIDWQILVIVSAGVCAVVLAGSLYKITTLSGGGKIVAEMMGGKLIAQNTGVMNQRTLVNVVEEMAIASGTPAPPVYVLADESGINAFAAGFSPRDAVIGVTQGTIDQLNRDQLQGVIAHEFSHILNGDMRLNIHLMGVLHGILLIGNIGYYILRSSPRSSRRNNKSAGGIMALGFGLMVIGYAGTFFGSLIKAAVSRQREFLADASAVQFTRNPDGIAGALKRIGRRQFGSQVENPGAPEISHAFFAQGVSVFLESLSATHPPLPERIRRIDPHWDGNFGTSYVPRGQGGTEGDTRNETLAREDIAKKAAAVAAGAAILETVRSKGMQAIDQIGNPSPEAINYAQTLLSELPNSVYEAIHEAYTARAVVYILALNAEPEVRSQQLKHLREHGDIGIFALTEELLPEMEALDIKYRLPLIEIVIPALKQLSVHQYNSFKENLNALIDTDAKVDLIEWSLRKILFNHLDAHFFKPAPPKSRYANARQAKEETATLLSAMAYAGHQNQKERTEAFQAAASTLKIADIQLIGNTDILVSNLDRSLQKLEQLTPWAKVELLKACAICAGYDERASHAELELLRAFSGVLDCPMPPVIIKA